MSKTKIIIVVVVLLAGLILKLHNYDKYPQRGASSDEYTYSFLGISLLTKGIPESWSNLNAYYNNYDLTIRGIYFPMVYPYFDHPPLNGLLIGAWSMVNNQTKYQDVDLRTIRLVPIFLSSVSSILLFLINLRLFNFRSAVWALLIYSTATIFVMNQKVVFAENLLTPILLFCIYFFSGIKKATIAITVIIGVLSGLAFWTKELGIAVFFSMIYLYIEKIRKINLIFLLSGIFIFFFIGYLGYGFFYDWDQFWKIISIQSSRQIGPETLALLTANPIIVNKPYSDGWYFLGFISIFFSLIDFKRYKLIVLPALVYLMLMLFSLNKTGEMGWYVIPLFPFMAMITADLLSESLRKPIRNWYIFLAILFVGFYEIKYIYESNFGLTALQFRILIFLMFGPLILLSIFHKDKAFKLLGTLWFYLLILGTIFITFTYVHPA